MHQTIFIIIVSILVFNYLLERVLEYLNNKTWSNELPKEAEGIYDSEKYKKAREYDRINSRFGFLTSTFSFLLMIGMLFFDGFAFLDEFVRNYTEHPILMALLFFGILAVASDILTEPFSLYSTFVIEEKFGFNRTTVKTYIFDKIKSAILGAIIGGGLFSLFVWFYETAGEYFWLYAWALVTVFMLFMAMFYSSLIVPLFNKLTPLEEGGLRTEIEDYCKKVGFKLNNLFVIDGSKRSTKANAFFSGLGPKKKIVLYDTLIEKHTNDELLAVLAHEVGHYKKKHTRTSIFISVLQTGLTLYLLSLMINLPQFSIALGAEKQSFHIGIIVFGMLYSPLSMILGLGMNILSRKNEFEADAYAKETYKGEPLRTALKKLSVDNLSNLTPHAAYVFFHYSHPPLLKRLKALKT
ncbi:MAG: peptidase M48 [Flavobacteriales bacterium]|nr:MAG: peptidase M48 [Flavobacteriales bacterium]